MLWCEVPALGMLWSGAGAMFSLVLHPHLQATPPTWLPPTWLATLPTGCNPYPSPHLCTCRASATHTATSSAASWCTSTPTSCATPPSALTTAAGRWATSSSREPASSSGAGMALQVWEASSWGGSVGSFVFLCGQLCLFVRAASSSGVRPAPLAPTKMPMPGSASKAPANWHQLHHTQITLPTTFCIPRIPQVAGGSHLPVLSRGPHPRGLARPPRHLHRCARQLGWLISAYMLLLRRRQLGVLTHACVEPQCPNSTGCNLPCHRAAVLRRTMQRTTSRWALS